MRLLILLPLLFVFVLPSYAQIDSSRIKNIFQNITTEIGKYKLDTSALPDDKITRKIIELRRLRGGFNINEAIAYKQQEDLKENKISKEDYAYFQDQFARGKARQWLDNATMHIYRDHFTFRELKQLVKFYKTTVGQKLANDFPIIMLKTLMAAQTIHEVLIKKKAL